MDNLEFLDGEESPKADAQPVEATPTPEPVAAEPEGKQRDEHGRFKAKEPQEPAQQPVAEAPQPEAQQPPVVETGTKPQVPPGFVPVSVVQELREEIKGLKQAPAPQQAPEPPQPMPDMFEDPEGFIGYQNRMFLNHTLNTSERFATREHGKETVEAAKQWMAARVQSDPYYASAVLNDPDPYEKIVVDFRRDTAFQKIGDLSRIDQFLAWEQAQQAAQQQQPAPTPQPLPTGSIASAPSAGGPQTQATGQGVAFDEMFKG